MKEQKTENKRKVRNDIILIISLLAVAAVGFVYLNFFRSKGDTVEIRVDGKLYGVYSLSQEIHEDIITDKDGKQLNRFVISNGTAFVETATCPDGICSAHSPIFRTGESIVCLPHRLVITVISADENSGPDVVV